MCKELESVQRARIVHAFIIIMTKCSVVNALEINSIAKHTLHYVTFIIT